MKKLFLILAYIFIPKLFFAQTKDLPDCKTIKKEIAEVHNSFDNIVEEFRTKGYCSTCGDCWYEVVKSTIER